MLVPPRAGMDGVGGWRDIYFNFTPLDDENHLWFIAGHVEVTGAAADEYRAKQADYEKKIAADVPAGIIARELIMLGSRGGAAPVGAGAAKGASEAGAKAPESLDAFPEALDEEDDDLPF